MIKCINAEWLKLKRSNLWIILIALPILSTVFGSVNFYFNKSVLTNGWYSYWTQISLFYGEFFLPILIAICCSYIARLEHLNKNWTLILTTPTSIRIIYITKLVTVAILMLLVQLFFSALYIVVGRCFGLSNNFPPEFIGWIMRGWVASISIISMQLYFSIRIKSFATPIGISLCCVFIGLGIYILKAGLFFPHSLLTIGMGVISQKQPSTTDNLIFTTMCIAFTLIFSLLSIKRLTKSDI